MVRELLVNETLTDAMINSGAQLIKQLDAQEAEVKSAFWFYFSDEHVWKLMLASPKVSSEGPKKFYKRIIEANKNIEESVWKVSLNNMGLLTLEDNLVQLLGEVFKTDNSINAIRFSKSAINGHFIDDLHIYRMQ